MPEVRHVSLRWWLCLLSSPTLQSVPWGEGRKMAAPLDPIMPWLILSWVCRQGLWPRIINGVTFNKLFKFPKIQFPHLWSGNNNSTDQQSSCKDEMCQVMRQMLSTVSGIQGALPKAQQFKFLLLLLLGNQWGGKGSAHSDLLPWSPSPRGDAQKQASNCI